MSAKEMLYDQQARESIRNGVKKLARAVKETLGPRGRNVIIKKDFGTPVITKDGVTVANEIDLKDPYEDVGAQMVKEVANKTSNTAGDGTTTATIYAEAIFEEGLKNVVAGADSMSLKRGIDKAVEVVVEEFKKMKIDVTDTKQIAQVGTSAANQDAAIGEQIAEAMDKVGKDGVITIEEGTTVDTYVELVEGMQFDKGYKSPHFATDLETMECELEEPYIFLYDKKLTTVKDIVKILEQVSQANKSILIVAEDIEGEALATLVVNKLRGTLKCCATKAPSFGDRRKAMLEDIAILTGARAITGELGEKLENLGLEILGAAKKVKITKDDTTIVDGAGNPEAIKGRINQIKSAIESSNSDYDKEKLEERLAKLSGGVAQINVGAATETEMKEKKARIDDALHACRAAVQEGVLPGGGVAPVRATRALNDLLNDNSLTLDEKTGVDIVKRALCAPIRQITLNAGVEGAIVLEKVQNSTDPNFGYNALTGQYGNLVSMGVLVPVKVERCALQNAASIGGLLLTTNVVVADVPKEENDKHPQMDGM
jgi:chaperonin GroEL